MYVYLVQATTWYIRVGALIVLTTNRLLPMQPSHTTVQPCAWLSSIAPM